MIFKCQIIYTHFPVLPSPSLGRRLFVLRDEDYIFLFYFTALAAVVRTRIAHFPSFGTFAEIFITYNRRMALKAIIFKSICAMLLSLPNELAFITTKRHLSHGYCRHNVLIEQLQLISLLFV